MNKQPHKYHFILICVFLIAAIVAVYWPVYKYDFVKYDDDVYVTDNIHIQSGFNWQSIRWAFTASCAGNWHPVTMLSHTLDYQLFKDWAGGHHITNILFHIVNTLILFYVLTLMTASIWPSAFVAAAFALHPLHIESVAWVAERKDVLSTFFWLLTMLAYVRYVKNPKLKWYLAAFVLFVLGLMSKPMLVTVPFVLLLLDYWPLERKISWRLLIEKVPFFICSFVSCVVTFLAQQKGGAVVAFESFGLATRINNAVVSCLAYITKMIWPSRLAVLYPHPGDNLSTTKVVISGIILLLISIYVVYQTRRHKFFAVGWFWFLGTLVPVIGLVQVGIQAMADRYSYIPLIGLFIIIAFGAKEFIPKRRYKILAVLTAVILIGWGITAGRQLRYWKDSISLFEHTLAVTENNYHIYSNYATYLTGLGRFNEAIEQFDKLLAVRPASAEAHNNLGSALIKAGKVDLAVEHFRLAIKYKPGFPQAYCNIGFVLLEQGKLEESVPYFKQALKIKPDYIGAYTDLARAFMELKKFDETIETCGKALKFDPDNVFVRGYLGMALAGVGKTDEAIKEISFVLNIRPNDVEMHRNLGILLERKGQNTEAIEEYRKAVQIDPNDINSQQLLESAVKKLKTS